MYKIKGALQKWVLGTVSAAAGAIIASKYINSSKEKVRTLSSSVLTKETNLMIEYLHY